MNALKILALAKEIKNGNGADISPVTFIFGCKAAPGYDMAKKIIKLISFISKELNSDLSVKDKIKVILLEDYNVSLAEKLIPAADLSEQISLAGKEASGTGCMKLMMNGALTIGTLDGANVEIFDEVGRENGYLFGLNSNEVNQLYKNGYNSREYYHNSEILKSAVDSLSAGIGGCEFTDIYDYLINNTRGLSDPYMCLADFNSYYSAFKRALNDYNNKEKWTRSTIINIANSGVFSADNAIKNYADKIWHTMPAIKNEKHK
jgi:starch phosphorylase